MRAGKSPIRVLIEQRFRVPRALLSARSPSKSQAEDAKDPAALESGRDQQSEKHNGKAGCFHVVAEQHAQANRKYSQWAGREKFFEREREVDPDMTVWESCVLACEQLRKPAQSIRRRPSTRVGANRDSWAKRSSESRLR